MANYDKILDELKAETKKANSLKLSDYEEKAKESLAADKKAEQKNINTSYDSVKKNTKAVYDNNLANTKTAYESEYQKNAVQKLINEKKIAETNANLGLTDSGLNRTQQTAAQLSYANQKGDLDIERQKAIDNITLELSAALTDIENSRNSELLASSQKWDSEARSMAQTNYNNDLTAYNNRITSAYEQLSEIQKAQIEADADVKKAEINASIMNNFSKDTSNAKQSNTSKDTSNIKQSNTSIDTTKVTQSNTSKDTSNIKQSNTSIDTTKVKQNNTNQNTSNVNQNNSNGYSANANQSNNSIIYRFAGFDEEKNKNIYYGSDGRTYYFDVGINPYVSVNNTNSAAVKKYGAFSNGYQPKGVIQYGIDYGKLKTFDTVDADKSITGVQQNIWYAADTNTYWMWDGSRNQYMQVYSAGVDQSGGTIWCVK